MSPPANSYAIVGAGNFGAATALAIKTQDPGAHVTLIDTAPFPNPRAASHDINKIIRPDYADADYMQLMAEAMRHWREDPLYRDFFHAVGMLRVDPSDFNDRCVENYRRMLGPDAELPVRWLTVPEIRELRGGVLRGADLHGVDRALWSPEAGWAEAEQALEAVIREAVRLGVSYCALGVRKLDVDEATGECIGVTLGNGRPLTAQRVVLCAGARSGVILADSAPNSEEIQAGDRIMATGAVSFTVKVSGKVKETFANAPVVKNCLKSTKGTYRIALASSALRGGLS